MSETITLPADGTAPPVTITLRRSTRARRMSLRVSRLQDRVTLTLPPAIPRRQAERFARERADWIRRHVEARPASTRVAPGVALPVEGVARRVVAGSGRRAVLGAGEIAAPEGREGPAVAALLKALARERLVAASTRHAAALGREFGRITLRDTRSRWGSCSSRGDLMFSWRLIMAPPEVLDYVAAHEVAHLAHMDHSAAFWDCCAGLFPDHLSARAWLRGPEGLALHGWEFTTP